MQTAFIDVHAPDSFVPPDRGADAARSSRVANFRNSRKLSRSSPCLLKFQFFSREYLKFFFLLSTKVVARTLSLAHAGKMDVYHMRRAKSILF